MAKIAMMISTNGWGGLEMNVIHLGTWLQQRGMEITLFAVPGTRVHDRSKAAPFRLADIPRHRKYLAFRRAYTLAKRLKSGEYTTLILLDNSDLDLAFLTKRLFYSSLRLIYQQHMQIGIRKKDWIHTLRYKAIDRWVSPLNWLKKEVMEKTNVEHAKIMVIPLGIETVKFHPPAYSQEEARNKLNIPEERIIIGILGRIDPKKGQLFLLQSVAELKKRGRTFDLLIMGEPTVNNSASGEYLQQIHDFIRMNLLDDQVHIRNHDENTPLFYQAIDVFALASEAETYGMVTLEAMISGKPVIATNAGGTPEILGEGEYGLLYRYNDTDDFCSQITRLYDHPENMRSLSTRARDMVLRKFSHKEECDQWIELLSEKPPN